jgi:hypothetical protein
MTAASALAVPQSQGSTNITVMFVNLVAVVTHKLSGILRRVRGKESPSVGGDD